MITSLPHATTAANVAYRYDVLAVDGDSDILTYRLVLPPEGMTIDAQTGTVHWSPTINNVGQAQVTVRVSDGQSYTEQTFIVEVLQVAPALAAEIVLSPSAVDEGESVSLEVLVANLISAATVEATLDGAPLALDAQHRATIDAQGLGAHTLAVTIDDGREPVTITETFFVRDPNDTTGPIADITSPASGDGVSDIVAILGTASDDNLAYYELSYRRQSESTYHVFASGNTSMANQPLGTLDPSMLVNGLYELRLEAVDQSGQRALRSVNVMVDGDLKVGHVAFTVQDLMVPLVGIPIEVNRTYDSRRRHELLDMGYGWSLDYQNVRLEESRIPGEGWALNEYPTGPLGVLINYCVEPMGAPTVAVTLPNGDVERFAVSADPQCNVGTPIRDVDLVFTAAGDTQSTLVAVDGEGGRLVDDHIEIPGDNAPIDPDRYRLTTRAGYRYTLDQHLGIETIDDPNGHTLTYRDEGIFHSTGKSVTFERNAAGLITAVVDPSGQRLVYERDANADLMRVIDRDTSETHYTYNDNHGLLDILDPRHRRVIRNLYDDHGRLIGQEDQHGNTKHFDHTIDARTSLVTDRDGRSTMFHYDARGNVREEITLITDGNYPADIVTTYTYDANDNQATRTIGASTWTTRHNASNDVLEARNPEGQSVFYGNYNRRGQEGAITDERGHTYTLTYDVVGNLTGVDSPPLTDPDTGETQQPSATNAINAQGLVSATTDLRGLTTTITYDTSGSAAGQKHTESNPVTGTVTTTYDANNNVTTETRERTVDGNLINEVTTYAYDARDRLIRTTHPDGTYTQTDYDLAGHVARQRDRFGNWTVLDHDAYGRLTRTTYPDGSTEQRTYSAEGLLETVTDRRGHTTRHQYDDAGRLWRVHNDADNTFTETRYSAQGWVIAEYDEHRHLTEYDHDLAGRRTRVIRHIDGTTQEHTFTYYPNGELASETDALGRTTTYILNALDQRIEVRYPNGTAMHERFDPMGTRTRHIDQENRATRFGYDALGRLTAVTPEVNIAGVPVPATTTTYDQAGNRLTQTDANGNTTRRTYDVHGRVLTRTLPEGQQESFVYTDGQGCQPTEGILCTATASPRTTVHTDFNGDTITMAYDIMGRLISKQYSKDNTNEVTTYYPNDQVQTVTDQNGTKEYFYDSRDRLIREIKPNGVHVEYSYDAAGNRTSVQATRNATLETHHQFSFDDLNRLNIATNMLNPSEVTAYTYDPVGNLDTVAYWNGLTIDYDYNSVNQLTDVFVRDDTNQTLLHFNYLLDATGRRTVIQDHTGRTTAYCYDALYRLTQETTFDASQTIIDSCLSEAERSAASYVADYQYDWAGNRIYETIDGVSTAYTYDNNDRLTQTGGTIFSYDDNGNTISEVLDGNITSYLYDGRNRLTSLTRDGSTTSYTYNHNGIRTSKTENGITTEYIVDENRQYAQVLQEVVDGNLATSYLHGLDLISQTRDGDTSLFHYDALGSTRALSDGLGNIINTYNYAAFGEIQNQSETTANDYLYQGESYDSSQDRYYLRDRWYDYTINRFDRMDVWQGDVVNPIALNKYLGMNADPANGIDPTGLFTMTQLSAAQNIQVNGVLLATTSFSHFFGGTTFNGSSAGAGIRCLSQVVESTMGVNLPQGQQDEEECGGLNQMRLQLQQGSAETYGVTRENFPRKGVTVRQMQSALNQLRLTKDFEAPWFPEVLDDWLGSSIIIISQRLNTVPGSGGVMATGTISTLKQETFHRNKEYRLEIENLRGHNLRNTH